jgi:hypothetical protein
MKIHQLSVFIENRPGHLIGPCQILAEAGLDIVALSLAETQKYGILRLIVQDWQQAKKLIESGGFRVTVAEVLAVQVADRPGGLVEVLRPISAAELNVEYMYAFSTKAGDQAVLVFRFADPEAALRVLADSTVNFVDTVDLFTGDGRPEDPLRRARGTDRPRSNGHPERSEGSLPDKADPSLRSG